MKRTIAVFTGSRADYGLLFWLMKDIQANDHLTLQTLVSGMHLSAKHGETWRDIEKDGFRIDQRVDLQLTGDQALDIAQAVGRGVTEIAQALSVLKPDMLVILGDRFEALAAAQAAHFLGIPIAHLHGGEITQGANDDATRHAITKLAHIHGVSTEQHRQRVIQMGEAPHAVHCVGAFGLDAIRRTPLMSRTDLLAALGFDPTLALSVLTYHPATLGSEDGLGTLKNIFEALQTHPQLQVLVTYPNADEGNAAIIEAINLEAMRYPLRVKAFASLGMVKYLSALQHAAFVVGNSSSGLIEAPSFGIPTINVGVRQRGRLQPASVIHTETDTFSLGNAITQALSSDFSEFCRSVVNPYGDGHAAQKMLAVLQTSPLTTVKVFHDSGIAHVA
jgi:UDP-2,4-diacetamido-2,4,6-trideoxy-beta-L-idose 2-epimerase